MRLSRKFLNDYIDTSSIKTEDLATKLVSLGHEYDEIKKVCNATNLVVGKVLSCGKIEGSDHLHLCKVDVKDEILDIVCGAPNVKENIFVIVALPGASLPGGTIKKTTIMGISSSGMLCSLKELGVDKHYLPEEDGIYIINKDVKAGDDALKVLDLDDEIIDFDVTPNRVDLNSVIGFAREASIFLDEKINEPVSVFAESGDINEEIKMHVETSKAPLYLLRLVKNVKVSDSPFFMKSRLVSSGLRPINNIVDISNFVMLEYGQPLHFFDYDKIKGNITVKEAKGGEKIITLDDQEKVLEAGDIVITSNDEIIALAGVMGCKNTMVTEETQNILIEAAIFDKYTIRKTAKRLNLLSDAAKCFIKGLNSIDTYKALDRAADLLHKYAGGDVIKGVEKHDLTNKDIKKVSISRDKINKVLSLKLSSPEILDILDRLNFKAIEDNDIFKIEVPYYRLDVAIPEDIIEEVARVHGINNILPTLPNINNTKGGIKSSLKRFRELRNRLISLGFNEVINYTLVNKKELDIFYLNDAYKVLSPMTDDHEYTRNSLLPSLYRNIETNMAYKDTNLAFIEMSEIYEKKGMKHLLSGIMTGSSQISEVDNINIQHNYYYLKGVMTNLLEFAGFNNRYSFERVSIKGFHPYQAEYIKINNDIIGVMGSLDPRIFKEEAYAFELDLDKIYSINIGSIKDKGTSIYPAISKDLAFLLPKDVSYEEIYNTIKNAAGSVAESINLFDLYIGDKIDGDLKSMAFNIKFRDKEKTLTLEDVKQIIDNIIDKCEKKGFTLRDK